MEPLRRKRPKRAHSAVAVLGGVALLIFELGKWSASNPEKWFWAFVAVLMIALGLVGVFQREDDSAA